MKICDRSGDGDCTSTWISLLIEAVEERVNKMDECIRKRLLTKIERNKVVPHVIDYQVGVGAQPEAQYDNHGDEDPTTGTYITVLDPVAVRTGSISQLRSWMNHEYVHHITFNPETETGTAHHPERGFWDRFKEIEGQRWCRG